VTGKRGARPSRLLRRARQHQSGKGVPGPSDPALVQGATAPQPAPPPELGAHEPTGRPMAPARPHHAPMALYALRRQDLRQEPSAVVPLAGICAGGRPQGRSLPQSSGSVGAGGCDAPGYPASHARMARLHGTRVELASASPTLGLVPDRHGPWSVTLAIWQRFATLSHGGLAHRSSQRLPA
jgi:hypothetical protein